MTSIQQRAELQRRIWQSRPCRYQASRRRQEGTNLQVERRADQGVRGHRHGRTTNCSTARGIPRQDFG